MADLSRANRTQAESSETDGPPSAHEILTDMLRHWVKRYGSLPAPAPRDIDDCASWWLKHMQEPEHPGETYQATSVGIDARPRWECGYALRARSALLNWLSLSAVEREAIVSGVQGDRVAYRGEPFAQYMDILEQTHRMRQMGIAAYVHEIAPLVRRVMSNAATNAK
jgi:hypothetical protein